MEQFIEKVSASFESKKTVRVETLNGNYEGVVCEIGCVSRCGLTREGLSINDDRCTRTFFYNEIKEILIPKDLPDSNY
ncbi:hypothetical protein [Bacteroides reticulotermitis]|uniref:hypothetical protein n=1 Tax=Bacteroides reticulotermitis TaxID=1133319 RepID=UPI003A845874